MCGAVLLALHTAFLYPCYRAHLRSNMREGVASLCGGVSSLSFSSSLVLGVGREKGAAV